MQRLCCKPSDSDEESFYQYIHAKSAYLDGAAERREVLDRLLGPTVELLYALIGDLTSETAYELAQDRGDDAILKLLNHAGKSLRSSIRQCLECLPQPSMLTLHHIKRLLVRSLTNERLRDRILSPKILYLAAAVQCIRIKEDTQDQFVRMWQHATRDERDSIRPEAKMSESCIWICRAALWDLGPLVIDSLCTEQFGGDYWSEQDSQRPRPPQK